MRQAGQNPSGCATAPNDSCLAGALWSLLPGYRLRRAGKALVRKIDLL